MSDVNFQGFKIGLARILKAAAATVFWLVASSAWSQTCSIPGQAGAASISTQPNTFFAGIASVTAGATSITVGTATGAASGIQPGDLLLIIQMQGADINATDTNAYGAGSTVAGVTNTVAFSTSGYAGGVSGTNLTAGTYEWAIATGGGASFAAGGTINLSRGLTNAFSNRIGSLTQGKQSFQVIRVPQYSNLSLGAGLTVQPWDGSRGGVLVLEASGDLDLAGQTINGNGRGFRGAGGVNIDANNTCISSYNTTGCQQFRTTISPQQSLGASKGEGLAGTPGRIYDNDPTGTGTGTVTAGTADGYVNGEASRGAPGNAGGGGNQHNGGGGGGGNGGAGGTGGNTWNSSQNGNFGLRLGGFGGSPSGNSATTWLMGGGGGAGDIGGNGSTSPQGSGGAGGALVVLRASRLLGGGSVINLNGATGVSIGSTDGTGGGGAGGTLVIGVGSGGLSGALTLNANGGRGGNFGAVGLEVDGSGGGGGGGALVSNTAGVTANLAGGAAGTSATTAGCAPTNCGAAVGVNSTTSVGAVGSPGVQVGYECLPNLAVTKATSTPLVTNSTSATAAYTINVSNSGGGARFVSLQDLSLPPSWTLATVPVYTYNPVQPVAAGRLSSGAETTAIATSSTWAVVAAPLAVPAVGSNTLTWNHFAIAPVTNGVPGAVTVSFTVNIPNTAAVGTYHNGAGVSFLDPTRAAASTRVVSPATNVTANRTGTAYGSSTYANFNGVATSVVTGTSYSGLQAGPTAEDVTLVPDFSVIKTAPSSSTPGLTFTYTLTPRNNGRAIRTQTFATTQATDVLPANVAATLGSNPLTVTDTLPAGIAVNTAFNGAGWTCTGTTVVVCTLANATAFPIAAATNFPAITATVASSQRCPTVTTQTNSVAISNGVNEPVSLQGNNTATAVTTFACASANLTVTKTNGLTNLTAGQTTAYTVTVANLGPNDASGTLLRDPVSTGLSCTAASCSVASGAAVCPATTIGALQSPGLTLATFPPNSSLNFLVTCGVTATGQ